MIFLFSKYMYHHCIRLKILSFIHLQINSQKEQITKLQSRLDNLTSLVTDIKAREDSLNKEVIERHVVGLCIEIVLILVLFMVFARRRNNQEIHVPPRRSVHLLNGHGPPRLAIEDGSTNKETNITSAGAFLKIHKCNSFS